MVVKRRFGVSIPDTMAERLDALSSELGVKRSRIVEEAIRFYLEDHAHYITWHECSGIITLTCDSDPEGLDDVIRRAPKVTLSHLHSHFKGSCLHILVVSGSSRDIAVIHSEIEKFKGCNVRFVNLHVPTGDNPAMRRS